MRAAGRLAAEILEKAGAMVRAGITTDDIDRAVHQWTVDAGAYPSPLTYGVRRPLTQATAQFELTPESLAASTP